MKNNYTLTDLKEDLFCVAFASLTIIACFMLVMLALKLGMLSFTL